MWENQTDAVPVVDLKTKTLIGYVRNNAIHLLLDSDALFNNRKYVIPSGAGDYIAHPGLSFSYSIKY